jgi:hypothetical protein
MTLSSESDSIYLRMKYKTENVDILYLQYILNGEPIDVSNSDFIEEAIMCSI